MKKIVTIGGGTGQYTLLRGLKNYNINLSAIVSIADNGGSSGELRTEFGILPPGDLRNCLLALADDIKLKDLMDLFEYRFPKSSDGKLSNHNLGNLILAALNNKHGNMADGIKAAANILNISGEILPVSIDNVDVYAETMTGRILKGEVDVNYNVGHEKINKVWLEPKAHLYKGAAKAIQEADLIIICAGDLYGSVIPNILVEGFKEAVRNSNAKIVYICNLVTKQGTYGFKASDFVNEIETYLGKVVDFVICNEKRPTQRVVDKYNAEDSFFVEPDLFEENIQREDLLIEVGEDEKISARHDSEKLARLIMELI